MEGVTQQTAKTCSSWLKDRRIDKALFIASTTSCSHCQPSRFGSPWGIGKVSGNPPQGKNPPPHRSTWKRASGRWMAVGGKIEQSPLFKKMFRAFILMMILLVGSAVVGSLMCFVASCNKTWLKLDNVDWSVLIKWRRLSKIGFLRKWFDDLSGLWTCGWYLWWKEFWLNLIWAISHFIYRETFKLKIIL